MNIIEGLPILLLPLPAGGGRKRVALLISRPGAPLSNPPLQAGEGEVRC